MKTEIIPFQTNSSLTYLKSLQQKSSAHSTLHCCARIAQHPPHLGSFVISQSRTQQAPRGASSSRLLTKSLRVTGCDSAVTGAHKDFASGSGHGRGDVREVETDCRLWRGAKRRAKIVTAMQRFWRLFYNKNYVLIFSTSHFPELL